MKSSIAINKNMQQGMVLLVTLIMIGLMSLVAVSSIRGSSMQEAMAGNMHDRNLAFQSAEAGLRMAEEDVKTNGASKDFTQNTKGLYQDQNLTGSANGSVKDWSATTWDTTDVALSFKEQVEADEMILSEGVTKPPQYVIERINEFTHVDGTVVVYRITCRGFGMSESSEVVLQSTYQVFTPAGS